MRDNLSPSTDKRLMNITDQARFFIVYPMDLEDLGLVELKEKFARLFSDESLTVVKMIPGGLEIECPLGVGLSLNTILRSPTRILLRLGEFKCRDAPRLYQKMSKFNWSPWLIGQTPLVESASINSRLFDSRKIEKAIQDGVQQFYRHKPVKKKYLEHLAHTDLKNLPKIYFRSVDDLCTISLDTTGERLHLRGEKTLTGLAPIRESLAFLLLKELQRHLPKERYTLIDPMCGSGSFLLEAHDSNSITNTRDFSYLHMALALENNILLKKIDANTEESCFKNFLGFDINPEVVSLARKNAEGRKIKIELGDLLLEIPHSNTTCLDPSVVIINPPYGIRVGTRGTGEEEINLAYYLKIIRAVKKKYSPDFLGIIIPDEYRLQSQDDFIVYSKRAFKNGGIEVVFYVLGLKHQDK